MDVADDAQPVRWKRDNLEAWRAAHQSPGRDDAYQKLTNIFNLAAEVPILKDALDWARAHDIEFLIDETTTAGAYYYAGSGVVGIGARHLRDPRTIVGFIVHEIRHAWQDFHHMLPTGGKDFAGYFMREALIEADATANQNVASRQYNIAMDIRRVRKLIADGTPEPRRGERQKKLAESERELEASTRDIEAYWDGFSGWFDSWRASWYGEAAVRRFAVELGVPDVTRRDSKFEYNPYENQDAPREEGIDVASRADLRRLGKTFNNLNYFNAEKDGSLTLRFTAAAAAQRFYNEKTTPMTALADEVRRRWLALKLEKGRDVMLYPY